VGQFSAIKGEGSSFVLEFLTLLSKYK
jgi:hypothetical protein